MKRADLTPFLLSTLFIERAEKTPDLPAYTQYRDNAWHTLTWGEAAREAARYRTALRREGLHPGDRVGLCLPNRTEWVLFDQAALSLGLVTVPLFHNDRPDNMAYCLNDAGAKLLFVHSGALAREIAPLIRGVSRIVTLNGTQAGDRAVPLQDWLPGSGGSSAGEPLGPGPATPDDLATLVYTSGTTGRPKGVMLTHRNILANALAALTAFPMVDHSYRSVSFLPLSHMFERTVGYYAAVAAGAHTCYARGLTELAEDIQTHKPTWLVCVPRIFERIHAKMQDGLPAGSFKRRLFEAAVRVGWRRFLGQGGLADALTWPVLHALVAKKLHARLGGEIRLIITGAAAFAPHLARTFMGLGLPIIQGYGLTEFSPIVCANRVGDNDPGSVGMPLEGVEVSTTPDGELLVRGESRMRGYWNNPAATDAVIDRDGWLHTGDLVRMETGRIRITGRAKEIIVLSNGEKVPPADAEQAIATDAVFEQVMIVGEGRAHLGLVTVSKITDPAELCHRANALLRDFPGYAKIHHAVAVSDPWTIGNGLLTPTLKIKRGEIEKRYTGEIEAMYRRDSLARGMG